MTPRRPAGSTYLLCSVEFGSSPFEVVAAKALVESHRTTELDRRRRQSERHLEPPPLPGRRSVQPQAIRSGQPLHDLEPFRSGDPLDWQHRGATTATSEKVVELMDAGLTPLDAAALFWWTRNQLYFDQRLWEDERIRILRYEHACAHPDDVVRELSNYIGIPLPSVNRQQSADSHPGAISADELEPGGRAPVQGHVESFAGCPGSVKPLWAMT